MIALVDSNIVIDMVRGYGQAYDWAQGSAYDLCIASITHLEVLYGARDKRALQLTQRLLRQFDIVSLTESDQTWAAQQMLRFRLSHNTEPADCLIASVAHRMQVPLYTRNLKHMRPLLGDLAVSPYLGEKDD